jgi:ribosome maturation protein SDO1
MTNVTARLKAKGKQFEILVDLDKALLFKKSGQGTMQNILAFNAVFSDQKKGMHAKSSELQECFGTSELENVAAEILKHGEIQLPAEYKKHERDAKFKQVVDFLCRNYVDPRSGMPHTPARIESALHEAHVSITDKPITEQLPNIIKEMQKILPLKTEVKRIEIKIPAAFTGYVYSLLKDIKEKEEWLDDGSLVCVINLPTGMQSEFYDKLNKITHGAALTKEMKQEGK